MLSKFIKEVKENDAKHNAEIAEHNAEIAELKKLKAEITKNKNDIAAVQRGKITNVIIMSNKIQLTKGNFRSDEFNQKEGV